ncbi:2-methoxy-6-polyprenyl-1,4-benzoquinol methylase, mitochondrial-like [Mya arenaria]|uniref:2-methoxy-6-polyprenyl-1,4-benzoquinol methylase, mitochondrial-like n=1 Tax=Mya arenaria TaxID=6604 RepID=UPI0022DFDF88|nr:2-methoxy-6-polyprenyl-1,4-benzoquinol methylase, mitochondrial-like [Mya arenaria]
MAASLTKCQSRGFICLRRVSRLFSAHLNQKNNINSEASDRKTTHFGFETVTEEEKEEKVYEVFKNVAEKYDLMNDAMSVGVHRLWKDHFIRRMAPPPGTKLLDVAGGTGDIAFRFLNYVKSRDVNSPPDVFPDSSSSSESSDENGLPSNNQRSHDCHVTVCDINQSMLEVGQGRAAEAGITSGISWLKGNAECLPVEDNSFDVYTIAFGIRNCTHIDKVVDEAYRVLRPGGRFMCLEFSEVPNSLIRSVYDEYSFQVIPVLGQVLAADWSSYQYLVESIRQFPNQETFKKLIQCSGFKAVTYENLTFGVVAIHSGFKL